MKNLFFLVAAFGFTQNICLAEDLPLITSENDKISYSVGYQLGEISKNQSIVLNNEIVLRGAKDALTGSASALTPEERRAALDILKAQMAIQQKERMRIISARNLDKSKKFLAENTKKDGVTVLPSGLQYKELSAGSGKSPTAEDSVTVHYRGTLLNGKEFDSSLKRNKPASFKVDGVIKGWTEALQLMREGDKWELYIPPELAYGEKGSRTIPPNSALVFEVELLSVD